jgi:hypothetical protein
MPELERALSRLGEQLEWPPTPDLAEAVTERLAKKPTRRRFLVPMRRSLAIALAGLLVLAGSVFAAVPSVRDAVLDFLGLQGATVERRETLPSAPPTQPLDLGTRTTLAQAGERLGFTPLVPAELGAPDGVFVRDAPPVRELSLTYRPQDDLPRARTTTLGLLVTEFRADIAPEYIQKVVGPGTTAERLEVDGERAIWIEGGPHFFFYRGPDGDWVETENRLAQNVLLLEHGNLLIRLEGAFDRDRAIELARSLR